MFGHIICERLQGVKEICFGSFGVGRLFMHSDIYVFIIKRCYLENLFWTYYGITLIDLFTQLHVIRKSVLGLQSIGESCIC